MHKITNNEVLIRMNKHKELVLAVKERKILYLGHVMRGERYEILRLIIEAKIQGIRSVRRRRYFWLKGLTKMVRALLDKYFPDGCVKDIDCHVETV